MAVIGNYTPATNWNIELVFTPDADMDNSDKRGCFMWEFQNGAYYHALIFSAFKWEWRTEQKISPTVTIKKYIDFDLDGVADTPFGYSYYKENLVPITITCVYDYDNQQRRIYVDGYLLTTDYQNIPAINQSLQLTVQTGIPSDRFYGTVDSIVYAATAPSPTPLIPPTPQYILTDYNKKYVPGSQNWIPVDDILIQYQKWPDPQFNITTNCWVDAAYDIQYFAGYNGAGSSPPAGILAKMLLIQAILSSNKYRHSVRFAVLQPAWDAKAVTPNTWKTLIQFANANPLVRAILGASVAHVVAIPPNTQPNLHTIPLGTPITAVDGIRNTFYQQAQYIMSLMSRPVNGTYVDDEDFSTNTNLQVWPNPAGVNMYVQFINYMFGTPPATNPNTFRRTMSNGMEFVIYDMFDLEHCVSLNQFPVNPLINVNSTGNASISQYTDRQKFWFLHQGAIRSLRFYLISKYYEIQAGRQTNQAFVQGGRTYEEDGPRPGCLLGLWKMYKVGGTERLYSAYFTPSSIGIQEPKGYCWQPAAASYVEAIFTPPNIRNILLFGTLLPGDVLSDPANPPSFKIFLFNTGNKLIACMARKYNGEYLIGCCYEPLNNYAGQPISKSITVNIDGNVLTLTARKQGSVYHRAVNGTLTWLDQWHEDSHFDWWGNVIINPNLNTDMAGINDLHDGYGYIYKVDLTNPNPVICSVAVNDLEGEREMRRQGLSDAPIGADSSATGLIQITNVASIGNITTIVIDGNDILNGNAYAITSAVPATEAEGLALWINGIVPAAGYRYFAFSIGDTVYLESPIDVGVLVNDLPITVTADDVSIVTVTTPFFNGTSATEVFDTNTGYRYFLNADYDANGTPNTLPAAPDSLTNAIDITKWMITRGNNSGMMEKSFTLQSDAILSPDRGSQNMLFELTGEGSASDTLVYIAPMGFVQGDLVYLKNALAGITITVESAPVSTSISPFKNIYLVNDSPALLTDSRSILMLQYTYDETLGGGVFTEISRAFATGGDCEFIEDTSSNLQTTYIDTNTLKPCNVYKANDYGDSGIIFRADTPNTFSKWATYCADYTGSGQLGTTPLENCEFDFASAVIYARYDVAGNRVIGASGGFPFGYGVIRNNQSIDGSTFTFQFSSPTDIASFINNNLSAANIVFTNSVANVVERNVITRSKVEFGGATVTDNTFVNCYHTNFQFGISATKCVFQNIPNQLFFGNVGSVNNCIFENLPNIPYVISILQDGKVWIDKFNTTENTSVSVTAANLIDMDGYEYAGYLTINDTTGSTNVEAILSQASAGTLALATAELYSNVRLIPDSTHTITIKDFSIATAAFKNILLSILSTDTLVLDGSKGDWAEFEYDPTTHMMSLVEYFNGI